MQGAREMSSVTEDNIDDMDEELEDDGQSELARMQKANLGDDADLAEYAIKGGDKVRSTNLRNLRSPIPI